MRNKKFLVRTAALLAALLFLLCSACAPPKTEERIFRKSTVLMDTLVTITVVAENGRQAEDAMDAAFAELRRLEKLISFWDPKSEISAMGRMSGIRPVKVSPETLDLVEHALYTSAQTDGAFDCTIGPEIRLWDFKKKIKPTPEAVRAALPLVGYKKVIVDKEHSTVFLKEKGMSFDTGGIAKGWAAERAANVLRKHGIKAALVALAGDIYGYGRKPDGHGWMVGVRAPRPSADGRQGLLARVEIIDNGISTSGDYERAFIENGVRYHHILDPKTGYPAMGFESVTIIAPHGVLADGFCKIFVMGPEKGIPRLNELSSIGLQGILVDSKGKLYITDGIKDRVTRLK